MQVTISLLPVSLSLVHVPRSRLNSLSHPILRQILNPNPAFLNITCNEIEISIFAENSMLQDFEPIARKDRQRQRSRSSSMSSKKGCSGHIAYEPVEISYDKWSVLQIDSHSDRIGASGYEILNESLSGLLTRVPFHRLLWYSCLRSLSPTCRCRHLNSLPVIIHERFYFCMSFSHF